MKAKAEVQAQRATRDIHLAQFFDNGKHYGAAKIYYAQVVKEFPQTPFSEQAKTRLAAIEHEPDNPPNRVAFLTDWFEPPDKRDAAIAAREKARHHAAVRCVSTIAKQRAMSRQQSAAAVRILPSAFRLLLAAVRLCRTIKSATPRLFPPDITTVYVPMVESKSFRPDLGEALTEAICKQIEAETPYKVVSTPNADSILTAKIIYRQQAHGRSKQVRRAARQRSQLSGASHLGQSQGRHHLSRRGAAAAGDGHHRPKRRIHSRVRPVVHHQPNIRWCRNWPSRSSGYGKAVVSG